MIRRAKQEDVCIYFGVYIYIYRLGARRRERGKKMFIVKESLEEYFREIRNNYSTMTDRNTVARYSSRIIFVDSDTLRKRVFDTS